MIRAVGYKSKTDLRGHVGRPLNFMETSMCNIEYKHTGSFTVVGSRKKNDIVARDWYALVTMKEGLIDSVK